MWRWVDVTGKDSGGSLFEAFYAEYQAKVWTDILKYEISRKIILC